MSQKEIKAIYESLIESGDFAILFPSLSGKWEEDKAEFKRAYDINSSVIQDDDFLNFDEEDYNYE
jgi:hypothetical protein